MTKKNENIMEKKQQMIIIMKDLKNSLGDFEYYYFVNLCNFMLL